MTDLKDYKLVEQDPDVTLLYIEESLSQSDQRNLNKDSITILSCAECHLAPTYKKFIANDETIPPSISRRFSIFCPRCSKHPLSMFTLEGMIGYWNRIRK